MDTTPTEIHLVNIPSDKLTKKVKSIENQEIIIQRKLKKTVYPSQLQWALFCHQDSARTCLFDTCTLLDVATDCYA